MNKVLDIVYLVLMTAIIVLLPHLIYMALWEFFTWGNAVWDMGEWSSLRRSGWLVYEVVFVIGILISDWG